MPPCLLRPADAACLLCPADAALPAAALPMPPCRCACLPSALDAAPASYALLMPPCDAALPPPPCDAYPTRCRPASSRPTDAALRCRLPDAATNAALPMRPADAALPAPAPASYALPVPPCDAALPPLRPADATLPMPPCQCRPASYALPRAALPAAMPCPCRLAVPPCLLRPAVPPCLLPCRCRLAMPPCLLRPARATPADAACLLRPADAALPCRPADARPAVPPARPPPCLLCLARARLADAAPASSTPCRCHPADATCLVHALPPMLADATCPMPPCRRFAHCLLALPMPPPCRCRPADAALPMPPCRRAYAVWPHGDGQHAAEAGPLGQPSAGQRPSPWALRSEYRGGTSQGASGMWLPVEGPARLPCQLSGAAKQRVSHVYKKLEREVGDNMPPDIPPLMPPPEVKTESLASPGGDAMSPSTLGPTSPQDSLLDSPADQHRGFEVPSSDALLDSEGWGDSAEQDAERVRAIEAALEQEEAQLLKRTAEDTHARMQQDQADEDAFRHQQREMQREAEEAEAQRVQAKWGQAGEAEEPLQEDSHAATHGPDVGAAPQTGAAPVKARGAHNKMSKMAKKGLSGAKKFFGFGSSKSSKEEEEEAAEDVAAPASDRPVSPPLPVSQAPVNPETGLTAAEESALGPAEVGRIRAMRAVEALDQRERAHLDHDEDLQAQMKAQDLRQQAEAQGRTSEIMELAGWRSWQSSSHSSPGAEVTEAARRRVASEAQLLAEEHMAEDDRTASMSLEEQLEEQERRHQAEIERQTLALHEDLDGMGRMAGGGRAMHEAEQQLAAIGGGKPAGGRGGGMGRGAAMRGAGGLEERVRQVREEQEEEGELFDEDEDEEDWEGEGEWQSAAGIMANDTAPRPNNMRARTKEEIEATLLEQDERHQADYDRQRKWLEAELAGMLHQLQQKQDLGDEDSDMAREVHEKLQALGRDLHSQHMKAARGAHKRKAAMAIKVAQQNEIEKKHGIAIVVPPSAEEEDMDEDELLQAARQRGTPKTPEEIIAAQEAKHQEDIRQFKASLRLEVANAASGLLSTRGQRPASARSKALKAEVGSLLATLSSAPSTVAELEAQGAPRGPSRIKARGANNRQGIFKEEMVEKAKKAERKEMEDTLKAQEVEQQKELSELRSTMRDELKKMYNLAKKDGKLLPEEEQRLLKAIEEAQSGLKAAAPQQKGRGAGRRDALMAQKKEERSGRNTVKGSTQLPRDPEAGRPTAASRYSASAAAKPPFPRLGTRQEAPEPPAAPSGARGLSCRPCSGRSLPALEPCSGRSLLALEPCSGAQPLALEPCSRVKGEGAVGQRASRGPSMTPEEQEISMKSQLQWHEEKERLKVEAEKRKLRAEVGEMMRGLRGAKTDASTEEIAQYEGEVEALRSMLSEEDEESASKDPWKIKRGRRRQNMNSITEDLNAPPGTDSKKAGGMRGRRGLDQAMAKKRQDVAKARSGADHLGRGNGDGGRGMNPIPAARALSEAEERAEAVNEKLRARRQ
ncbi:hypothetical protein CYMTET_47110 [Cymbomonas tetramitiformis]|uniref:Uncharacterized protein n=1 Tax=Cymbomonas tetramitiformis TaxID=36881 RepID=A0AAE0BWF1_9CHLO|nr:hypothetical protein CYMTET_47110 [Cymbomonas tetramitiformis]